MAKHTVEQADRRDVLKKIVVGTGIAAAAPVVSTFAVPANAAITSNAQNQFQLTRGTVSADLTAGAMTGTTPTNSTTCDPANWNTASATAAGDFTSGGGTASITSVTRTAPGGIDTDTIVIDVTVPTTCQGSNVPTDLQSAKLQVTYTNGGGSSTALRCPTLTSVTNTSTSGGTLTFTQVAPTASTTNLRIADLRLVLTC